MKQWDVHGIRIELHESRPEVKGEGDTLRQTQRWLPPYLSLTYLAPPALDDERQVLDVIEALADAGSELHKLLSDYHSGVLL